MRLDQVTALLSAGDLPYQSGIERLDGGMLHVAVLTRMPQVTPAMFGWWFGDYLQTTEHYKRWHPRDHVWMAWENKQPGTHVGASHLVHEYIGGKLNKLRITFLPSSDYFGNTLDDAPDSVAVCAVTGFLDRPIDFGRLVHLAVPRPWGCDLHSRFWLGDVSSRSGSGLTERLGNTNRMRRLVATDTLGRALLVHCHEEMTNLSEFLPALYARENGVQARGAAGNPVQGDNAVGS